MLQIRLSKGGSLSDVGAASAKSSLPLETVTVACPDHLVLADLPVAKSLGAVTSSTVPSVVKSVGRRSRRHLGDRVHFCVCCDYPIAIYGRLIPCEHAFCFTCARSDSSCYLCDERIQKIQTIKMMEGIFICAAPHCLKSFLKRFDFEAHIHELHADLLQQSAVDRDGANETDAIINIPRPPSTDPLLRQPSTLESSSSRGHLRTGFSPSSNQPPQDRDDRGRRNSSREQTPLRPLPSQPKQLPFHGHHPHHPTDMPADVNPPRQALERPYNWYHHQPQSFDGQSSAFHRQDPDQSQPEKGLGTTPEASAPNYPALPAQLPTYQVPVIVNPPPLFSFPPFPADGSQRYLGAPYELPRPEMAADGGGQVSLLGFPPASLGAAAFPDAFRAWGAGLVGAPSEPPAASQGAPESYMNPTDSQARVPPFFRGEYGRFPDGTPTHHPTSVKEAEPEHEAKGAFAPLLRPPSMSLPLPPPPPPPPMYKWGKGSSDGGKDGQGYGWQSEKRAYGNGPD